MQRKIFISGTDTEVGKTFFTTALISALQKAGHSVIAYKPVAAGCEKSEYGWQNEDALAIIDALEETVDYQTINPFAFKAPVAPHIAAAEEGVSLSVAKLQEKIDWSQSKQEFVLVEGAGGWLVPLNDEETLADYVQATQLEVILVVGMKLGCINHALLSKQCIESKGLKLCGWVANYIDPRMQAQSDNLKTLKARLEAPLLAEIPFIESAQLPDKTKSREIAAECVRIERLLSVDNA